MEKRTLLAVVLSVVIIVGYSFLVPMRQPAPPPGQTVETTAPAVADEAPPQSPGAVVVAEDAAPVAEELVTIDTPLVTVLLSNSGGDMVSYKLKEHKDKEEDVEMILGAPERTPHAFSVAFGKAEPVTALFSVRRVSEYVVEFSRNFSLGQDPAASFRLTKRYEFKPKEYMFELNLILDGGLSSFNFAGEAYTLSFGPQIGPSFAKLDQRYEYRNYYSFANGKLKKEKVTDKADTILNNRPAWVAIAGKYFTLIAVPLVNQYDITFSARPTPEDGRSDVSKLSISRPALNSSKIEDTYRFYLGPKNQDSLAIYNNGDNSFNMRDTDLIKVASTSGILAPLEFVLKWFLMIFYRLIPNYGVAIILLTLLVKILFFPLTKKGSEATLRMQTLAPKIKELQDKYKDKPAQMQSEMAAFYKKEGYNPLAGCLPMLLQLPIFFAMYNLFNTHFDLRGAGFIPHWIPDLSLPESVYTLPFRIPLLGWGDIRLLPFIYLGSQLLYGKVTQTPDQQGNAQMKMMLYAMPIIFFFILYDVPSGLLVYWIMSNLLTLVQQVTLNKYLQKRKAEAKPEGSNKIVPNKNEGHRIAPKKKKRH
jgi:YidC/Oxa1 family membrane protein insertase